jgi:hypothetical protein
LRLDIYGRRVWRLRHGIWAGIAALAAMVCVFVLGIQPAASQPNVNEKKVRICHATSAEKNPYEENEPAIANNGDLQGGHLDHTGDTSWKRNAKELHGCPSRFHDSAVAIGFQPPAVPRSRIASTTTEPSTQTRHQPGLCVISSTAKR